MHIGSQSFAGCVYDIRYKAKIITDQHDDLGRTMDNSVVQHQEWRLKLMLTHPSTKQKLMKALANFPVHCPNAKIHQAQQPPHRNSKEILGLTSRNPSLTCPPAALRLPSDHHNLPIHSLFLHLSRVSPSTPFFLFPVILTTLHLYN